MSVVSPTILAPLSRLGVVQHGPHLWHEWLSDTFFILPCICRLFTDILTLQCHLLSWNSYNATRLDVKCIDTENKIELLSPTYLGLGWKEGWFSICLRAHCLVLRVWRFELDNRPHVHGRWSRFLPCHETVLDLHFPAHNIVSVLPISAHRPFKHMEMKLKWIRIWPLGYSSGEVWQEVRAFDHTVACSSLEVILRQVAYEELAKDLCRRSGGSI